MKLNELYTIFCTITWDKAKMKDKTKDKEPMFLENWKNPTKKTEQQIVEHFKKIDAGLGIATGKVNGLTVIDFDTMTNELIPQLYELAPTYCVQTKKGIHFYYKYHPYFKQGTNRFSGGVDVRNDGGLVFAPPTPNYKRWGDKPISEITPIALELLQRYEIQGAQKGLVATETRNDTLFRKMCGWLIYYPEQEAWNRSVKANKEFHKGELTDKELEIMFNSAKTYQNTGITPEEKGIALKNLWELEDEGVDVRYPTGFYKLDNVMMDDELIGSATQGGLALGEFVAIAGRPKSGKTLFTAQIGASLTNHGLKILWLFYEGKRKKLKRILERLNTKRENVISADFKRGMEQDSRIEWIEEKLKEAIAVGVNVLVIDNLDFLETGEKQNGEYEALKVIVKSLARMAVQYNVIVILIAHVRKPLNSVGAARRPRMYDIAGTSQVERLCDFGIVVDREQEGENYTNKTTIYLENNRPSGEREKIDCLFKNGRLMDSQESAQELEAYGRNIGLII